MPRNLHKTVYFIVAVVIFKKSKILYNQFSPLQQEVVLIFSSIENKKYTIKIRLTFEIIEHLNLHSIVYFVF